MVKSCRGAPKLATALFELLAICVGLRDAACSQSDLGGTSKLLTDEELLEYFSSHGVMARVLDRCTSQEAERHWREIYGNAFRGRPRLRQGIKAESEYSLLSCSEYRMIPFTSNVKGIPVHVIGSHCSGIECFGKLVPLGQFHAVEFFISPMDYQWTMVHA